MNNKNITHIVFDLDDTLTDSYSFNQDMFVETFRLHVTNLNRDDETYLRQLHKDSRGVSMLIQFEKAKDRLKISENAEVLVAENEALHINKSSQIKAFNNTKKLLEEYKSSGKVLSICTNRQTKSTENILMSNKIDCYFTKIVSCSDMGHEKPDPYCLLKLMDEFGIKKKNVLYVGDSQTDEKFAISAGVEFELVQALD